MAHIARLSGEHGSKSSDRELEGQSICMGASEGGNIGKYA